MSKPTLTSLGVGALLSLVFNALKIPFAIQLPLYLVTGGIVFLLFERFGKKK